MRLPYTALPLAVVLDTDILPLALFELVRAKHTLEQILGYKVDPGAPESLRV